MQSLNVGFILLFVESPEKSAQFYSKLLGLQPIEQSPTFALFLLDNTKLGLWSRYTAEPKVIAQPGCAEICFVVDNVDEEYEKWKTQGLAFTQDPTDMDFGRTFVALDPDGHRIRMYRLWEEQHA